MTRTEAKKNYFPYTSRRRSVDDLTARPLTHDENYFPPEGKRGMVFYSEVSLTFSYLFLWQSGGYELSEKWRRRKNSVKFLKEIWRLTMPEMQEVKDQRLVSTGAMLRG
jgi:hypothetical protein